MSFKRHSDATLMGMTKAELVDYVRMCEHNREVAEQTLAQHIENVKDWQPVHHARWAMDKSTRCWRCTNCGIGVPWDYTGHKRCHVCGAIMDGGDNHA